MVKSEYYQDNSEELREMKKILRLFRDIHPRLEKVRESLTDIFVLLKTGEHQFTTLTNRMDALESRMDSLESRMDSVDSRMDSLESSVKKNGEDIRSMKASLADYFAQQEILIRALTEGIIKAVRQASPI